MPAIRSRPVGRFAPPPSPGRQHAHPTLVTAPRGQHIPLTLVWSGDEEWCWWILDRHESITDPRWLQMPAVARGVSQAPVAQFRSRRDAVAFIAPTAAGILGYTLRDFEDGVRL